MDSAAVIKTPRIDEVTLEKGKRKRSGTLFVTATHLMFVDSLTKQEIWVQHMTINGLKKKPPTNDGNLLKITCKTFLRLNFWFANEEECTNTYEALQELALPGAIEDVFAFSYQPTYNTTRDGWQIYHPVEEYKRLGVPNEKWELWPHNMGYKVCGTYPSHLFLPLVPQATVEGSAKFRSKGRLPSLSYLYRNQACICRCSQPLTGMQSKRSAEDEELIQAIHDTNPSGKVTMIVDTRPKVNAMANKAGGKGYENVEGYPSCELIFHGIHNIHVMRESLAGLVKACELTDSSAFLTALEASQWLKHCRTVLDTSLKISDYVTRGHSVVVHCSDGWDRTAQTCSIAQLILDPYYRTLNGFIVLVEKEWLSFGHKFQDRNAFVGSGSKEVSPIFLQFLECVHHLSVQFPLSFEFNDLFLITLHDSLHSCQFGTFLGNCEKTRKEKRLAEKTHSVWSLIFSREEDFRNPFYSIAANKGILQPSLTPSLFELWTSMYCRWNAAIHPSKQRVVRDATSKLALMKAETQSLTLRTKFLEAKIAELEGGEKKKEDDTTEGESDPLSTVSSVDGRDIVMEPPILKSTIDVETCQVCQKSFEYLDPKKYCFRCGSISCHECIRGRRAVKEFKVPDQEIPLCTLCLRSLEE